jgi:hypothetical protein
MYLVTIKTIYNIIKLEVDDIETNEMKEIFAQPYVLDIKIEEIKEKTLKK